MNKEVKINVVSLFTALAGITFFCFFKDVGFAIVTTGLIIISIITTE